MNVSPIANFLAEKRYWLLSLSIAFFAVASYPLFATILMEELKYETEQGTEYKFQTDYPLTFETDYKQFFRDDDPQLVAHEDMEATYTKSDAMSFIIGAKEGDMFTPKRLALVESLTEELWKFPRSIRVDSISNYTFSEARGFDLNIYPLFKDVANMSPEKIAKHKAIALGEYSLVNRLVSEDGKATTVSARILMPENDPVARGNATKEVMTKAREMLAKLRAENPDLEFHIIGVAVVDTAFNESTEKDMSSLVPIMFVTIIFLAGLLLRSATATLSVLVLIVFTVPATIGTIAWLGLPLNQVSVTAPLIIMTLCVCDAIHILASHLQEQRSGTDKYTARLKALDINLQPVFLTSITTAIGFLSLNFSDSPPFREWGTVVAIGVMYAWLFSLGLIPSLLGMIQAKEKPGGNNLWLEGMANWVLKHRSKMLIGGTGLAIIIISFLPRNELTDSTYQYFDPGVPLRDAAEFLENNVSGFDNVAFSLSAGETDGITDPEYLNKLEAFATWARSQPYVVHVDSFTTVMKRLNKNLNEDNQNYYKIPEEKPLAVEALMLYEMGLPFGVDLNNQINFDKSATRFNVQLKGVKAKQIVEFEKNAYAWLEENAPELKAPGSSVSVMFAHIGQNNIKSMLVGSLVALIGISITLLFALKSWRVGLVSLIPNSLPAMIAFGIWGIFVAEVNLAAASMFSITLGIVVDDTVHFLSKYLRARRSGGLTAEEAVRYAYKSVGAALLVTTVAVGGGFMILAFSDFVVNELTGILTAITITVALLYDLLVLPALLVKVDPWLKLKGAES